MTKKLQAMKKILLLVLFTTFSFSAAMAQNSYGDDQNYDNDDDTVEMTDEDDMYEEEDPDAFFIDHKILPGERMIMISRKYMIDPKEIYKYNEWAISGYDAKTGGGVLKIPLHKSQKKDLDAFKEKLEKERGGPIQVPTPKRKKKHLTTDTEE